MIDIRYILGKEFTRIWKHLHDTVELRGVEIPVKDIPYPNVYRMRRDLYEQDEAGLLPLTLEPGLPVIELGAGFGFISDLTSKIMEKDLPHLTVEPDPGKIETLKGVRESNNANFEIVEAAYSTEYDKVGLTQQAAHNPLAARVKGKGDIPTVTMEELHEIVGGKEFVLISDMETGEQELFENEPRVLEDYCTKMMVEFHGGGVDIVPDVFQSVHNKGDVYVFENVKH